MKRKELKILGLSHSQTQIGSYVCVLTERKGGRKIPLIVKTVEAQKIALELEGIKPNRPSSYDFIKTLCESFDLDIQEVYIYALLEGLFYTKVVASNGLEDFEIEISVGDALALSVLFKCPIFTTGDILNIVGVIINDDGTTNSTTDSEIEDDFEDEDDFDSYLEDDKKERIVSLEDLEKLMLNAIENEEYEIAAELRDRIQKLKNV